MRFLSRSPPATRRGGRFRQEVLEYARRNGGRVYSPVQHPDLMDIPSSYGDERYELIRANLPLESGSLLDIGSHWGYFCHKFEAEGFDCYAAENNPEHTYFLERLRKAANRRFAVITESVVELRERSDFDVVLALNVFLHFLWTEETHRQLTELLKRLKMRFLFVQLGTARLGASINYTYDEFRNFIAETAEMRNVEYIGQTHNRPIYRFEGDPRPV